MRCSCCDVTKLKDCLKISDKHWWPSQTKALQGAKYNYDEDRALQHIQRAQNLMQKAEYSEALELLRQAAVCCPPSEMTPRSNLIEWGNWDSHDCERMKEFFPYDDFSLLPGQIKVLKTKCYMKMGKWKKALAAAEEAMFRLFEAQDGMDKGRTATPLFNEVVAMRYEIFTALNRPYQAMRDAAYLTVHDQERQPRDTRKIREVKHENWINLQRAQLEFECKYGYNLLATCTMCFKGNGQPVQQCYNCGSMFCSARCQAKAWDKGHKEFCQTRWNKLGKSHHKNIIPACRDGASTNLTWCEPEDNWNES